MLNNVCQNPVETNHPSTIFYVDLITSEIKAFYYIDYLHKIHARKGEWKFLHKNKCNRNETDGIQCEVRTLLVVMVNVVVVLHGIVLQLLHEF